MKKIIFLIPLFIFAKECYYNKALYAYEAHNYKIAEKYFKLACDKNNNALGCYSYSEFLKDKNLKNQYLKKACKLGLKLACK